MKMKTTLWLLMMGVFSVGMVANGQTAKSYQLMSADEREAFVRKQTQSIAHEISGRDYEFTPEFTAMVQKAVDAYATRVENNGGDRLGKGETRYIMERGQSYAPTVIAAFKARKVSPLIGLYIPFIESEYTNLESPNAVGAIGLFQFLPKTGQRFGLTPPELLDVQKSADAAAQYISTSMKVFSRDPMKEALALLAYNRGEQRVAQDLLLVMTEQNQDCSICALTAAGDRLDRGFQTESIYYVPMFFAAAIVGENPGKFGLKYLPLSSYAQ